MAAAPASPVPRTSVNPEVLLKTVYEHTATLKNKLDLEERNQKEKLDTIIQLVGREILNTRNVHSYQEEDLMKIGDALLAIQPIFDKLKPKELAKLTGAIKKTLQMWAKIREGVRNLPRDIQRNILSCQKLIDFHEWCPSLGRYGTIFPHASVLLSEFVSELQQAPRLLRFITDRNICLTEVRVLFANVLNVDTVDFPDKVTSYEAFVKYLLAHPIEFARYLDNEKGCLDEALNRHDIFVPGTLKSQIKLCRGPNPVTVFVTPAEMRSINTHLKCVNFRPNWEMLQTAIPAWITRLNEYASETYPQAEIISPVMITEHYRWLGYPGKEFCSLLQTVIEPVRKGLILAGISYLDTHLGYTLLKNMIAFNEELGLEGLNILIRVLKLRHENVDVNLMEFIRSLGSLPSWQTKILKMCAYHFGARFEALLNDDERRQINA